MRSSCWRYAPGSQSASMVQPVLLGFVFLDIIAPRIPLATMAPGGHAGLRTFMVLTSAYLMYCLMEPSLPSDRKLPTTDELDSTDRNCHENTARTRLQLMMNNDIRKRCYGIRIQQNHIRLDHRVSNIENDILTGMTHGLDSSIRLIC